jgi:hypothetical protein
MVTVIVTMKKSVLLLSDAEIRSILVSFPTSKGAIEFRIFPVDRKNGFTLELFTEDREMAWCVGTTDTAVILWAMLVTVPMGATVMTDEVVVRVGGYHSDVGRCGGHQGRRMFAITVGKVGRGRSGGMCDSHSACVS